MRLKRCRHHPAFENNLKKGRRTSKQNASKTRARPVTTGRARVFDAFRFGHLGGILAYIVPAKGCKRVGPHPGQGSRRVGPHPGGGREV